MQEPRDIKKAGSADDLLLVVAAMAGQGAGSRGQGGGGSGQRAATLTGKFNDDVEIPGAIMTKLDGDTRGGSALSVRNRRMSEYPTACHMYSLAVGERSLR
jgi:signal recognition particle subunit SRP54